VTPARIKVLLIEDNPGDANLVRRYLDESSEGVFEIEHLDRLETGLDQLRDGDYDVLLLDLDLPDSKGLESFGRANAAMPHIPIVVMTGRDDDGLALQAVREGAQDYMVKRNVGPQNLVRSIHYAIERKRSEEALRESEERFALAVTGANDGVWDWNLQTDEIFFSDRWKEMLGFDNGEIDGDPKEWFDRVHPADIDPLRNNLDAHFRGRTQHFFSEYRMRHRDGTYRWMLTRGVASRDGNGRPSRMAGSLTDIHAQKMTQQQLLHEATHDALTDLSNWTVFMDQVEGSLAQARRRADHDFAVLFLDLDRFKTVNDSLGHALGDLMLVHIARRLKRAVRPRDSVARLGGDEFAILLRDIESPRDATRVARRIHAELSEAFDLQGHEVYTSTSIGIALNTSGYERAQDMLRDADIAMYRAKAQGKARHAIFDEEMHRQAVALLKLETDLRRAVARDEFDVHYQPIVDLNSGKIDGFEALVRWEHPDRGLVVPDDFIRVAEETGMIHEIDWMVMEKACRQLARWRRTSPGGERLGLSVNLSSRELGQPRFVTRIQDLLDRTGIEPNGLRLEITESMILRDTEVMMKRLNELDELGVGLHMDDFGTGYSSLSYLHSLPIQTIKIDRSFVSRMTESRRSSQIVGTIVALARNLGMSVSAEGLERPEHITRMRELSCEFGQGFVFAPPLDSDSIDRLLATEPSW
jgi:diguanylate cyclase (GGDEF)-like protein/PAS domain S-box-containing protein